MPKVSIIMNCFNCGKYLREALDSAFSQTYRDFEVIFWDNLSHDDSVAIAKRYPVKFFSNPHLLSLGVSRNLAIEQASGKYIAFLDCDDVWLPTKLEKQVTLLESNTELALVYSDCYHINAEGIVQQTSFATSRPQKGKVFDALFADNFIPMVTAVARKGMMFLFNPRYSLAEEYDIWLKMANLHPFDYVNEPLAKYRTYPENASSTRCEQMVAEQHEIANYWLGKKPHLGRPARRKSVVLSSTLAYYYLRNRRGWKLLQETTKLLWLLPDSLALVCRIPYAARKIISGRA